MVQRANIPSSTTSEEELLQLPEESNPEAQSQSQPQDLPSEPFLTTIQRFTTLYLTTLFSFDNITAARLSPHSLTSPSGIPPELRRSNRGEDYGEGEGVGFRMDPGGRPRRDVGRINGGAGNIDVPACRGCKYSAAPTIG
ncbi:hypothetical protein Vi05172_g60 [Venturia inaequalis]|uniref:Uncharacterized protein n=1 Tax=Venturia inaequalis TaxID=5025 RepID=A0A8H3Z6B9_VENIN|nr:hypothetical protein EG327_004042 [Venturia inaequalis]RDI90010.1 hypothetical protein Vi05172_g60 [Venturia inaequalis]